MGGGGAGGGSLEGTGSKRAWLRHTPTAAHTRVVLLLVLLPLRWPSPARPPTEGIMGGDGDARWRPHAQRSGAAHPHAHPA